MKLFSKAADGGKKSGVTGYFLIEWKRAFSVVLLHFDTGTREAFHEHAFNAWTLWLKGRVREYILCTGNSPGEIIAKTYKAGDIKYTARDCFHMIDALEPSWAISVRGPWVDYWREFRKGKYVTLTHGRKEVEQPHH